MIFYKKITICNLFAYYGEQSIEFSPNNDKPLYLIYGRNGYGKTSFIRSLKLLFLGSGLLNGSNVPVNLLNFVEKGRGKFTSNTFLLGSKSEESKWEGALNKKAIEKEENRFFVEILLEKDGKEITIKRLWQRYPDCIEKLEILSNGRKWENNEATEQLEQILPSSFIEFFIFDGEEIEILAENIGLGLKEKIQNILNITILDKLLEQTKIKNKDLREQSMQNDDDRIKLKTMNNNLQTNKELLQIKQERHKEIKEIIKDMQNELDEKQRKRDKYIENYAKDLERLRNEKQNLENQIQNAKENIKNNAGEILFLGLDDFAQNIIQDIANSVDTANLNMDELEKLCEFSADYIYEKCNTKETNKSLFLKLHKAFEDFTSQNNTSKEYKNIKNLSKFETNYKITQNNTAVIKESVLKIKESEVNLQTYNSLIRQSEIDDDIKTELDKAKQEINNLQNEINNNQNDMRKLDDEINDLNNKINENEKEIGLLNDKTLRDDRTKRQLEIIKELENIIKIYKEKRIEKVSQELKDKIFDNYKRLLPNDNVASVEIKNFAVYLKNSSGETIAIANQSAGQKQIVAISVFWALSELSGRKLPLIIDTPLARMDSQNKANIIKNYYFEASNQIIVLPHDGEFRKEEYQVAKDKIQGIYEIKNDESRSHASIQTSDINEILGV